MFSPFVARKLNYDDIVQDIPGTWVPDTKLNTNKIKDQKSVGRNNTTLLISQVGPIYVGHELLQNRMRWEGVEDWVARTLTDDVHTMTAFSDNPNRNIDYVRTHTKNGKKYYQFIEVKKTSGHTTIPPVIVKSSEQQRDALIESTWGDDSLIHIRPSLYAIVSVDYEKKSKSWGYSLWVIPVRKKSDFLIMKTSTYRNLFPINVNPHFHYETKNNLRSVSKKLF